MKKKLLSTLLAASMVAGMMVGCGDKGVVDTQSVKESGSEEGSVLNIYVWNEEFKERVTNCYPGYEKVDDVTGKIGDVTVVWNTTPSENMAYQNNLDAQFEKQLGGQLEDDDKIDLFLIEADYALKYVDSDATMALSDLGLSDADFANQYKYTQDVVRDANGNLKGSSWQGCPGALIYRRDVATEVLGADDHDTVQAAVKDWDTFLATAGTMKAAGYRMTCTANDSFRVFSNNVTSKWVTEDKKINVDPNIKAWVEMSKAMVDAGQTDTYGLWSDDWNKGMYRDSNVFCYFGPAWLIDFCMHNGDEGAVATEGQWGIVEGPQGFFWGGTWVCAANGTDNPTLVADLIKTMTTDQDVLTSVVTNYSDFVNDQTVMDKFATDETFADPILGGQNPYGIFVAGVKTIDLSNTSAYDQTCNEEFQNAMKEYFDGNYATYEEALDSFYTAVEDKQPVLSR